METPLRIWSTLESVPGLKGVAAVWKDALGPEYGMAKRFLRPNGKFASSYPCPLPDGCGCAHGVVMHSPGDIVAVCRCVPKRCDTFSLKRTDLAVYELNWSALGTAISSALQLIPEDSVADSLPMTRRIGTYSPYADFRFPVYLTIQTEPNEFRRTVEGIVMREDGAFILLAPTRELCRPDCEKLLKQRNSCFLPLINSLTFKVDGTFTAHKPVDDILADFRAVVLPSPKDNDYMVFFPTPPDATWGDVSIKFKDGHTVSIKVGNAAGTYNYTQMGMANKKNGNPTKQWELLESFATAHGKFSWDHSDADSKNQKRRETLAKNLREFFRIDEDPFRWTKDSKAWEALFTISYDE